MLPKLSWDLVVIMFFFVTMGYSFILQRERSTVTLISTYIALAVTIAWGDSIYGFLSGDKLLFNQIWFTSNFSPFTTKVLLFAIIFVLLSLRGEYTSAQQEGSRSTIFMAIYSFLNAGLIVSACINFLDPVGKAEMLAKSPTAKLIANYDVAWIVLPALIMIIAGFIFHPTTKSSAS